MKCPKCNSIMIQLFNSWVCDGCNPPDGGLVSVKEKGPSFISALPPVVRMITIKDINFYDDNGNFEIAVQNCPGIFKFSKNETLEIREFIQMNLTNQGKTYLSDPGPALNGSPLRITPVVDGADLKLEMHFPGYMIRLLNQKEYQKLLMFMAPFVKKS